MVDQVIDTTKTSVIIPEVWSARFFEVLMQKNPFNDAISYEYEGEIQDLGDIVNISTIPEFDEAEEVSEGARVDADAVTVSGQQLVINKRLVKDFLVTKRANLQSLPHMDKLREHAVFSIMKKMQSLIIADTAPAAGNLLSFASGTTLALVDILSAKDALDALDVMEENRSMISGTAQANDLFNVTGFTSRDFIPAGSPLSSGSFSTPFLGFELKSTTALGNEAYFFHPSYMSAAVQDQLSTSVYDLGVDGKRAARVNTDVLMGLKQLDENRVAKVS